MGSVYARGDTFLTFGWKALTDTNTSRRATAAHLICHWSTSSPIVNHSPLVSPVFLDSYITCYPFAHGSLITLLMEAVRSSETLVNISLTTRQYIPENSKRYTRRRENLKYHITQIVSKLTRRV
jgi:hypothetical protein